MSEIHSASTNKASLKLHLALLIMALVALAVLQYQYRNSDTGHKSLTALKAQIADQQAINEEQARTNNRLYAEVKDLKNEALAIEEYARLDLGLIKPGETFVQLSNAPVAYGRYVLDGQGTDATGEHNTAEHSDHDEAAGSDVAEMSSLPGYSPSQSNNNNSGDNSDSANASTAPNSASNGNAVQHTQSN